MKKEIELNISLDNILDLLKGAYLTTIKDGIEISIRNSDVGDLLQSENQKLPSIIKKWESEIIKMSNLLQK